MLTHNRERLEALYLPSRPAIAALPSAGVTLRSAFPFDAASSPAAQRLTERFGNRWRCQITAQGWQGAEAIVLCKLLIDDLGLVKTQFGHASIGGHPVVGSSGGLRFSLGARERENEQNQQHAYRRAAEAALTKCLELV